MGIKTFWENDSGAITVDWVMITAGVVGLALATTAVVVGGVQDLSGETQSALGAIDPGTAWFGAAEAVSSAWGDFAMVNRYGLDAAHFDGWAVAGGTEEDAIMSRYMAAVAGLDSWADRGEAIDALGAAEAALLENGYGLPSDTPRYEDVRISYSG